MAITSATYNVDSDGNKTSVHVVYADGLEVDMPIDGATWRNAELNRWLAADPANVIGG